ncbi:hypothetical protein BKA62DRAFT_306265 [Auriculariales sp. MPI-PUGE-AT-0066]|nr:hypothetical protein BKA62DRAFT_306265 [Auriculariales sp. MPI-PUGE-AT-0066]
MFKHSSSRASNQTSSVDSTSSKTATKKTAVDLTAIYGADFSRAVAASQFLNGGSLNDAIARVKRDNEKKARHRAQKMGVPYVPDATAPVCGPNGELFRDTQEESEHRGLLRNAYKGMSEPSSTSRSKGMRADEYQVANDNNEAAWAKFQAAESSCKPAAGRHENARADFFASSFAPVPAVPSHR